MSVSPGSTSVLNLVGTLAARRPHKFTEERLRAYKFRSRIGTKKPRYAHQRLKTPDVLLNSRDAQIFSLPEIKRALFIVRPPPSAVPPEIAYPISAGSRVKAIHSHPLAHGMLPAPSHLPQPRFKAPTDELSAPVLPSRASRPGMHRGAEGSVLGGRSAAESVDNGILPRAGVHNRSRDPTATLGTARPKARFWNHLATMERAVRRAMW